VSLPTQSSRLARVIKGLSAGYYWPPGVVVAMMSKYVSREGL